MSADTDIDVQFTNRIVMAFREHDRRTHPAAACNNIYWVARLYPTKTTQDVIRVLAQHCDPKFAQLYLSWRFRDVTSRA